MLTTVESMTNSEYFLGLTPEGMWRNVLCSGEALGSVTEQ